MSAITKEQLQQIEAAAKEVLWPVVWSEKKARKHFSEKITPEVALELARIALAAQAAGPVYQWRERYEDSDLWDDCTKEQYEGFAKRPDVETRILYTAPPAPVVPEEVASAIEKLKQTLVNCNRYNYCFDAVKRVEEACRAAMLNQEKRNG